MLSPTTIDDVSKPAGHYVKAHFPSRWHSTHHLTYYIAYTASYITMRNIIALIKLVTYAARRYDPPSNYCLCYILCRDQQSHVWSSVLTGIIYICKKYFSKQFAIFSPVACSNKTTHGPLCARVTQNCL